MYSYSFTEGEILSECIDSDILKKTYEKIDSFGKNLIWTQVNTMHLLILVMNFTKIKLI